MTENQVTSIFRRLPGEIFSPLASPNRAHYWGLLLRLYETRFGPDAPSTAEDGARHRDVTSDIEHYLSECHDWVDEDGQPLSTPLVVRANLALNRLLASGWLKKDRIGARDMITMPTVVQSFLELLQRFAEEGPQFVGGKVQTIHTTLEAVHLNPAANAPMLHEAAIQSRALIASISSTSVRARDVIAESMSAGTTGQFVASFFGEFITKMYIGDFNDLKSTNHPMRNRHRIIDIASELRNDPARRETLISSYRANFKLPSDADAEVMLEKDLERVLRFREMPYLIDRLNDSFRRATSQAVSYMASELRSSGKTEMVITQAIQRIASCDLEDDLVATPFAPLQLFCEENLPEPPRKPEPVPVLPLRNAKMTAEQWAASTLRRAMQAAREANAENVTAYVARHLAPGEETTSDAMPINSVSDMVCFYALLRAAYVTSKAPRAAALQSKAIEITRGLKVEMVPGEYTDNEHVFAHKFTIKRVSKR